MGMPEDKLSGDQRLRLEALAQAIVSMGCAAGRPVATADVTARAAAFEGFIRGNAEQSR
jgi:hypothetical protein